MRALPTTTIPGLRKLYVRRADVERLLDENTAAPIARDGLAV